MNNYEPSNEFEEWCSDIETSVKENEMLQISDYSCQIIIKEEDEQKSNHFDNDTINGNNDDDDNDNDDDVQYGRPNQSVNGTIYDVQNTDIANYFLTDGKFDECYFDVNLRRLKLPGDCLPFGYKKVPPEELYCFLNKPTAKDLKREREKIVRDFLDQYCEILFMIYKYFLPIDVRMT